MANRTYYLLPNRVGVVDYYETQVPVNNGGGASELAEFLQTEVLSNVLKRYNIDDDRVGLAGFSMGGLFAAWHLVSHPEVFNDYLIISPPIADPFVGPEFKRASEALQKSGLGRRTRLYVAYSENDLGYVLAGARQWVAEWQELEDTNLLFHADVIKGLRHDAGAVPALINGYEFLYGR